MIGAVELGDGQPGRSVHSCIPYLQTSDLSPRPHEAPVLICHLIPQQLATPSRLIQVLSQSWPETVSATGQTAEVN